jgi:hypothetical protein
MTGTGFKGLIIGLLLVGLFAISMINGGIILAQLNNANNSIADHPALNLFASNLNQSLEGAYENANSSQEAISSSPITLTTGFPVFDAISGIWKTLIVIPMTLYNLIVNFVLSTFLSPTEAIVLSVIGAVIIITVIFGVWKLVATGQSN